MSLTRRQAHCHVMGVVLCSIFLVFEYCTHDLGRLVDAMPRPFSPSEVKCLMLQVCQLLRDLQLQTSFR